MDLQLSRLVSYGIRLGIGAEACIVAASLSLPKSLFRVASPLIHPVEEFNSIVRQTFLAAHEFDGGVYSEPIMMLKMFIIARDMKPFERSSWGYDHGIALTRLKLLNSVASQLVSRVNSSIHHKNASTSAMLDLSKVDVLNEATLNRLRLILLWTSESNIIRMKPLSASKSSSATIQVGENLRKEDVDDLFPPPIHFTLNQSGKRIFDGNLSAAQQEATTADSLRDLALVGKAHDANVVWLEQNAEMAYGGAVVFSILDDKALKPKEQSVLTRIQAMFDKNQLQYSRYQNEVLSFAIVIVGNPTKRQKKSIRELHNQLSCSISLEIPMAGSAKLVASNCIPTHEELEFIFLGSAASGIKLDVSTQILHANHTLIFPDDDEMDRNFKERRAFLKDFPLGYRLFNSYRLGQRDK